MLGVLAGDVSCGQGIRTLHFVQIDLVITRKFDMIIFHSTTQKSFYMRILVLLMLVCLAGCRDKQSETPEDHDVVNHTNEANHAIKSPIDTDDIDENNNETSDTVKTPISTNSVTDHTETNIIAEVTIGNIVLKPMVMVNGKLSLLVPKDFSLMGEEMLRTKYPSDRRPTVVYTDESGGVNIAINHTNNLVTQRDIPAVHRQVDSMFRNLYPSAKWFKSELVTINKRKWFMLNLRTPAIDTEIRNIIVGTSLEGRMLMVSFNSTKKRESVWLEPANRIIESLKITD